MTRLLSANHPTGLQAYTPPTLGELKATRGHELDAIPVNDFILMSSGEAIRTDKIRSADRVRRIAYSAQDNEYIKLARGRGETYREIGKILGRSAEGVQHRAAELGLTNRDNIGKYHRSKKGTDHAD